MPHKPLTYRAEIGYKELEDFLESQIEGKSVEIESISLCGQTVQVKFTITD